MILQAQRAQMGMATTADYQFCTTSNLHTIDYHLSDMSLLATVRNMLMTPANRC